MNLLEIAELRERLKEDIAVIERFMDIARREKGLRPLYDPPLPPTIEEQLREAANLRDAAPPKAPFTPEADRLLLSAFRTLQARGPAPAHMIEAEALVVSNIASYLTEKIPGFTVNPRPCKSC